MKSFRSFVEKYQLIPNADWEVISNCFRRRAVSKNEFILKEDKICRHLYFLESGLLRYFTLKDGVEMTKFFTIAPYCFTSQASFNTKRPSRENIQAIEESVIWEITYEENHKLLELKHGIYLLEKSLKKSSFSQRRY